MKVPETIKHLQSKRGPDPRDPLQLLGSYAGYLARSLRKVPASGIEDMAQEYWLRTLESAHKHDPGRVAPGRETCAIPKYARTLLAYAREAARLSSAPRPSARTVAAYLRDETIGSAHTQAVIRSHTEALMDVRPANTTDPALLADARTILEALEPRHSRVLAKRAGGMNIAEIARSEGVSPQALTERYETAIKRARLVAGAEGVE